MPVGGFGVEGSHHVPRTRLDQGFRPTMATFPAPPPSPRYRCTSPQPVEGGRRRSGTLPSLAPKVDACIKCLPLDHRAFQPLYQSTARMSSPLLAEYHLASERVEYQLTTTCILVQRHHLTAQVFIRTRRASQLELGSSTCQNHDSVSRYTLKPQDFHRQGAKLDCKAPRKQPAGGCDALRLKYLRCGPDTMSVPELRASIISLG